MKMERDQGRAVRVERVHRVVGYHLQFHKQMAFHYILGTPGPPGLRSQEMVLHRPLHTQDQGE